VFEGIGVGVIMKRDWDLIKMILLIAEDRGHSECNNQFFRATLKKDGYEESKVDGHLRIMLSAGFFESMNPNPEYDLLKWSFCLSWKGHDFLDAIRNESIWSKVKKNLKDKALTVPFDILFELLKVAIRSQVGL
jgi:hypothetical protein